MINGQEEQRQPEQQTAKLLANKKNTIGINRNALSVWSLCS
jgi:hypothetical protein